jgi:hypothetical protein
MEQLPLYAKEFFWIFLKQKQEVEKPAGWAFFHPYNGVGTKLEP